MNLNDYFDPVELNKPDDYFITSESVLGRNLKINTSNTPIDEISNYQIALFGVPEESNSYNKGTALAPDVVRNKLYQLFRINNKLRIIDLGNLKPGKTFSDTYFGLREIVSELLHNQLVSIIIGGSQDLTTGCFMGYEQFKNSINLVTIDSTIDLDNTNSGSDNYLSVILKSNKLLNYINIGHQQYLTSDENISFLNNKNFELHRLGIVRNHISLMEPVLRDADLISLDIGSVKQGDSPGRIHASPNGFFSDEICKIARYAGISDRVSTFGLFELNPKYDINNQTSGLAAQIIWHFIDGFSSRINEYPEDNNANFKKFIISNVNNEHELIFLKSIYTERWWMEIPVIETGKSVYVACSQEDYNKACNHEIPDRWWKSYQKLN